MATASEQLLVFSIFIPLSHYFTDSHSPLSRSGSDRIVEFLCSRLITTPQLHLVGPQTLWEEMQAVVTFEGRVVEVNNLDQLQGFFFAARKCCLCVHVYPSTHSLSFNF